MEQEYGPVYKLCLLGKNIVVMSTARQVRQVRKVFKNGTLLFHTNDRPMNTTKYVYQNWKHIGFGD